MKLNLDLKNLKLKKRPKPKESAVGVYLGPEGIEISYLQQTPSGVSIVKNIVKDISRKDVSAAIIKELFQKEGIKETVVSTTLPVEPIMLRRFTMPIIPPQDRANAIKFEAKRHIPFNLDEVISNYQIIKEDKVKNQMEILFAAVRKEELDSTVSLLKEAGLTVEKVVPSFLALIKSVCISGNLEETSPPTALLHFFSKTNAQILIVENGIPYLTKEISLLGRESKIESHLFNEIRLFFSYYKREFPEKSIEKVLVTGLREKPAWISFLQDELRIPVENALPLKKLANIDLPQPQLEIPIGLAARRIEIPLVDLNLLPEETLSAQYNIAKIIAIEAVIAVGILAGVYFTHLPPVNKLKLEVKDAEAKKIVCPKLIGLDSMSMDEIGALKTSYQQKKDFLLSYNQNKVLWHKKLIRITELIPKETWITQLSLAGAMDNGKSALLTFKGSTYTENAAMEIDITSRFAETLKKDPSFMEGFKKLTLGNISKAIVDNLDVANFDISLKKEDIQA